ncbi:MAG TPA: lipopolysaccharide assembly protein LapA domain-containing protein [Acidimicrobiales bacterium]|nr:lipopolysaccharide assembly protein LapA domain-containing protein [Acidimicrobiales bacterium]
MSAAVQRPGSGDGVPPAVTPTAGPGAPGTAAPVPDASLEPRRTRTGTAYVASIVGIVVAALVIVFIVQNLHDATVHFLPWTFRLPEGVTILASAVAGALVVLLVSLARILQLRLTARRHRRRHAAQTLPG